jgi:hypothetical protein
MRYQKRVRDEAIAVLLCCADERIASGLDFGACTDDLTDSVAVDNLANAAYDAAMDALLESRTYTGSMVEDYTEAAALLLDGWNPGAPVHAHREGPRQ